VNSLVGPFAITEANAGLIVSLFTAPSIVLIPVAGLLADRYGRKHILVVGLLVYGVAGTAIMFANDFTTVLALRVLQGVGFSGIVPIIITSIGDAYADDTEAAAQGLRFTTSGLSQALFPALAGLLVVFAWQYPFAFYALSVPIALMVALWFDEPTETTDVDDPPSAVVREDGGETVRSALRDPETVSLLFARALPTIAWVGFLTYVSVVVDVVYGGGPAEAGLFVSLGALMFAAAASQVGRVFQRAGHWLVPIVGGNACLVVGMAVFGFAPSLVIAGAGVIVIGIGFGVNLSLFRSLITGVTGQSTRGSIVSIGESFGRIVASLTPVVIGWLLTYFTPTLGLPLTLRWTFLAVGVFVGVFSTAFSAVAARNASPDATTVS